MSGLNTLTLGERGSRVVFLHGLFGQGRNWNTIARELAGGHRVTMVDLPNHGRSAWTDRVDHLDMADSVAELLQADDPAVVVGHSLGGKVAMILALRHPSLVAKLVVADMSPVTYGEGRQFNAYVDAMRGLPLGRITRREDADAALAPSVPDPGVRAFLLQNLRRDGDTWHWQLNLDVLARDIGVVGTWPEERLAGCAPFTKPVLWLAGERSDYVLDEYAPAMRRWFPHYRRVTIRGAGHWVHSDQPATFTEVVRRFADAD